VTTNFQLHLELVQHEAAPQHRQRPLAPHCGDTSSDRGQSMGFVVDKVALGQGFI
jgi:hypothetical protein